MRLGLLPISEKSQRVMLDHNQRAISAIWRILGVLNRNELTWTLRKVAMKWPRCD
jgi:hypothetical protein